MLDNRRIDVRMKFKNIFQLLIILSVFFFFLRPPTDPDLGWHLRYGQQMWQTYSVPRVDTFSSTMSGYRWADSYWLSEVLIYALYTLGGYYLLSIIFSLIATLALIFSFEGSSFSQKDDPSLGKAPERLSASWRTPDPSGASAFEGLSFPKEGESFWGLLLFAAVLLVISFVGIRPQTISLFFFSLIFYLLQNKKYRFLPFIFLTWANLHAGFVLGLVLVWLWFLGEWLESLRSTLSKPLGLGSLNPKGLITYPFICSLVTLVNPYGPFLWQSILQDAGSLEIKQHIAEWAPPLLRSDFGFLYFVYLVLLLILLGINFRREKISYLLPVLFFVFLSLSALRHIPLLVLLTLPFAKRIGRLRQTGPSGKYIFLWVFLVFFFVSVFSFLGFLVPIISGQWTAAETRGIGDYPVGAVAYLKAHPLPIRTLNTYGWGGYFLWNVPGFKTFIDGRMPGWRVGNQPTLFSEYLKAVNLQDGWQDVLNKYDVHSIVIDKSTPLSEALRIKDGWKIVYKDNLSIIFQRI